MNISIRTGLTTSLAIVFLTAALSIAVGGQPAAAVWLLVLGLWWVPSVEWWLWQRVPALRYWLWQFLVPMTLLGGFMLSLPGAEQQPEKSSTAPSPVTAPTTATTSDPLFLPSTSYSAVTEVESKPGPANESIAPELTESVVDSAAALPVVETAVVARVIDGDTIELANGERVRLIGINAPEQGTAYATEATEQLAAWVEGITVRLEGDVTPVDRYGRRLAYVFVDERFINAELVRIGLAQAYPYEPDTTRQDELAAAEATAIAAEIGIWQRAETSTSAGANKPALNTLSVIEFRYDSPGNDNLTLNEEFFVLQNVSSEPQALGRLTASDAASHTYHFPDRVLTAGATLTVRTGSGVDTATVLHWGSDSAIWNNGGDTLTIRDKDGGVVLVYRYPQE